MEEKVVSVRNDDTLPFSFFRDTFDRMQDITRRLHDLELLQIDEMKQQMERLILFLSETENHCEKEVETPKVNEKEAAPEVQHHDIAPAQPETEFENPVYPGNVYAENVVFPDFKDPRATEKVEEKREPEKCDVFPSTVIEDEKSVTQSFNDTIQAPASVLDFKRGLSLNDRFLFQRELFDNDHLAMNNLMLRLNAFDTYEASEQYLREHTSWNFEDKTVKEFLQVVKRRFE